MILADKIIELRKRNDWSQEELAAKLGVSRQAISKWESVQSTPDLKRILAMSELFGVSTDYLMKDEMEEKDAQVITEESGAGLRRLSLEEANAFLDLKRRVANPIAFGVWLCIMSSIPFILSGIWQTSLIIPFAFLIAGLMIVAAVALFLLNGFKLKPFAWMEKEAFETAYGVHGMATERLQAFMPTFVLHIVLGLALCILAVVALMFSLDHLPKLIGVEENVAISIGVSIIAFAVYLFVRAGIIRSAYAQLLQEEDYRPEKKALNRKIDAVMGIYWLLVTAIYLGYSFITEAWDKSWIIWPVAGVLCGVLSIVLELVYGPKKH